LRLERLQLFGGVTLNEVFHLEAIFMVVFVVDRDKVRSATTC